MNPEECEADHKYEYGFEYAAANYRDEKCANCKWTTISVDDDKLYCGQALAGYRFAVDGGEWCRLHSP